MTTAVSIQEVLQSLEQLQLFSMVYMKWVQENGKRAGGRSSGPWVGFTSASVSPGGRVNDGSHKLVCTPGNI